MVYDPMGSTVKYARACEHLEAIRGIVETWSKSTTYETISEPDPDGSGLVHCWRYVAKIGGPEFPDISALLGDCLNNFRAVLDHTIWFASVLHSGDPPPKPKQVSFPAVDDSARYKAQGLHAVSPRVAAVVELLQPYHAGNDAREHPLWALCELNNYDKHRQLHAVNHVTLAPVVSLASSNAESWMEVADSTGILEDGALLARLFTPRSTRPTDVEVNLNVTHGPAIMETETTPYLHLGTTLSAMRAAVQGAAKSIVAVL
jgi:hypothetical protein